MKFPAIVNHFATNKIMNIAPNYSACDMFVFAFVSFFMLFFSSFRRTLFTVKRTNEIMLRMHKKIRLFELSEKSIK